VLEALALVVGVTLGAGATWWWIRRNAQQHEDAAAQRLAVADGELSNWLREAVDHLEIGVLVVGDSAEILYRNAAAQAFRGTHVGILLDDHVASTVKDARAGASKVEVVKLQGPPKLCLEISADRVPSGGAVVTIRDISERVRTDAMRTDFVTNISHELKTPVGAVAVLAEALIEESDADVVRRLSDHLVDEAHRAVKTIDDLLQLSEIESTRPGDDVVDLTSVVHSAISRGRIVDGGRGVEITALDVPNGIFVRGDERQLVSAVGNLVENAVKYSHTGDVVQVRTRVDDTAVEVMVADQGIGIPTRDLDRVFERFYRVDKARSRDTGGTGLGLAIVRHVATNHGGDVLVSSQEGEGSTFVLRLPASLVVTSDAAPHDPRQPGATS
jgi:two-component system sensor histidine kinase SenX3